MRSTAGRAIVGLVLGTMGGLPAAVAAAPVPDWIASADTVSTGRPLWVSAAEAAPGGSLRMELFDPGQQDFLRQTLQHAATSDGSQRKPEERCASYLITGGVASEPWSPSEILERSEAVYSARIDDVAPGFLNGHLGTLIAVTVREVLKAPVDSSPLSRFYVFHHSAMVPLEEGLLCSRDARAPATPKVGGLLVLARRAQDPDWRDQSIFVAADDELFFDTELDHLSAPHAYGDLEMAASDLETALRMASRKGTGQ